MDAVRAGCHQPQLGGVQIGFPGNRLCRVRGRRAFQSHVTTQGADGDALDALPVDHPYRDLCEPGDDTRGPDDDSDSVRSGHPLERGVRRTDMGRRAHEDSDQEGKPARVANDGTKTGHATSGLGTSSCPTGGPPLPRPRSTGPSGRPPLLSSDYPSTRIAMLRGGCCSPTDRRRRRSCVLPLT